jgi:hypothetical protein
VVLSVYFVFVCFLHIRNSALSLLLNLHLSQAFLLVHDLVLHAVFLFDLEVHVSLLLVVLATNDLGLLGLLLLREEDRLLHFALFILALLVEHIVLLRELSLAFVLLLIIVDFLPRYLKVNACQAAEYDCWVSN